MKRLIKRLERLFRKKSHLIQSEKNIIRLRIKELKRSKSDAQKREDAAVIFDKITATPEFKKAKSVLVYWSSSDELPTQDFITAWKDEKCILLPIVVGEKMEIKRFSSIEKMKKGYMGIWEPFSTESYCGEPDLILVPGIAFDLKKNRLGRGKGFYDRYFAQSNAQKWGIGFDFQLLNSVPYNEMDVRLDKIFTPLQTIE